MQTPALRVPPPFGHSPCYSAANPRRTTSQTWPMKPGLAAAALACSMLVLTIGRPAHAGAAAEQAISSVADSSQAAMAASQFRTRLASERDTTVRGDLHYGLFRMLLLTRAPADTILAEAESSAFAYRSRPNMIAEIHRAVAETFLGRHERLDEVKRRAIAAEALLATAPDGAPYRAMALALRARAQGLAGSPDSAATTMRRALAVLPDGIPPTRQDLELRLGGFEQAA